MNPLDFLIQEKDDYEKENIETNKNPTILSPKDYTNYIKEEINLSSNILESHEEKTKKMSNKILNKKNEISKFSKDFLFNLENIDKFFDNVKIEDNEIEKNFLKDLNLEDNLMLDLIKTEKSFSAFFETFKNLNFFLTKKKSEQSKELIYNKLIDDENQLRLKEKIDNLKEKIYSINNESENKSLEIFELKNNFEELLIEAKKFKKIKSEIKKKNLNISKGLSKIFNDFIIKIQNFLKNCNNSKIELQSLELISSTEKINNLKKKNPKEEFLQQYNKSIKNQDILMFHKGLINHPCNYVLFQTFREISKNSINTILLEKINYNEIFKNDFSNLNDESRILYNILNMEEKKDIFVNKEHIILPILLSGDYYIIVYIKNCDKEKEINIFNPFQKKFSHLDNILFFLLRNTLQLFYEKSLKYDKFVAHEISFKFVYKSLKVFDQNEILGSSFLFFFVIEHIIRNWFYCFKERKGEDGFKQFEIYPKLLVSYFYKIKKFGNITSFVPLD